jgi:hypothetical protein
MTTNFMQTQLLRREQKQGEVHSETGVTFELPHGLGRTQARVNFSPIMSACQAWRVLKSAGGAQKKITT